MSPPDDRIIHSHDLQVQGMSCQHCVRAVTRAIHQADAAAQVDVDLSAGQVHVQTHLSREDAASAIVSEGYDVMP